MKDKLERFIRDNREDFDAYEPPGALWEKLEPQLPPAPVNGQAKRPAAKSPFRDIFRNALAGGWAGSIWTARPALAAAVVTLLLLAGAFVWLNEQYGVTEQPEVVVVSPTYAKEFVQYARLIDDKRTELRQLTAQNPALYQQFATDLDRLERSYQNLKADLPANPNQEMLIRAMVQNLQLQIDLLNQQLNVIQRIKQQQTDEEIL